MTALRVTTPEGKFFAIFPDNALHCELKGHELPAISYFESKMPAMFKPHGYPIVLSDIEPGDFLKYCHRPDLDIAVEAEFQDIDYDMLVF